MSASLVTAKELRSPAIRSVKNGLDPQEVGELLERAAATLDDQLRQIGELHQTIAILRAESATVDLPTAADTPAEEILVAWLASLDPLELERHVQAAIAESMVESTIAARRIRQEAIARTQSFADEIATHAVRLGELISAARGSATAMSRLPSDLASWQGQLENLLRRGLEQLQLPWSNQISQVAQLLAKMNGGRVPAIGQNPSWQSDPSPPAPGQTLSDSGLWG